MPRSHAGNKLGQSGYSSQKTNIMDLIVWERAPENVVQFSEFSDTLLSDT